MNSKTHIFERVGRLGTVFWFVRRHFLRIFSRLCLVVFVFWLTFGGGVKYVVDFFMNGFAEIAKKNTVKGDNVKPNASNESNEGLSVSSSVIDDFCKLVLISPDSVCFADGIRLKVGDTLYNGHTLKKIDYENLCCVDDGGSVFWLRVKGKTAIDVREDVKAGIVKRNPGAGGH